MADEQKPKKYPIARKDRVRFTILVYRKPGMSRDEFQRYWREEHSDIFSNIAIVKKNLVNYEQVRRTCIDWPWSATSQGLTSDTLSLQAHVNGEVRKFPPEPFPASELTKLSWE